MKVKLENDGCVTTDRDNERGVRGRWQECPSDSGGYFGRIRGDMQDAAESPTFKTKRELRDWFVSEIERLRDVR